MAASSKPPGSRGLQHLSHQVLDSLLVVGQSPRGMASSPLYFSFWNLKICARFYKDGLPSLKIIKLFRLEKTFKIPSPHTVFCVSLGNERRLMIFFFPVRNVFNFLILFALTLAKKLLEKLALLLGFYTHPTPRAHGSF